MFTRLVSRLLIICMIGLPFQVHAGLIGTDEVVSAAQAAAARTTVASVLNRSRCGGPAAVAGPARPAARTALQRSPMPKSPSSQARSSAAGRSEQQRWLDPAPDPGGRADLVASQEVSIPAGQKARARAGFLIAALAAACGLGGCISLPQTDALRESPPQGLPRHVELTQVPFHLQDDFLCGPASLAMVFNAAGVPADVESVTPLVYLPGRKGSLQAEMLGATRRSGLVAYPLAPQLEDLLRELAAGTPVVVLLISRSISPPWHTRVGGFDLTTRVIVPRYRSARRMGFGFLEYFWKESILHAVAPRGACRRPRASRSRCVARWSSRRARERASPIARCGNLPTT